MKPELIKELFGKSDKAQKFFSIGEPYTGKHFEAKEIVHKLSVGDKK